MRKCSASAIKLLVFVVLIVVFFFYFYLGRLPDRFDVYDIEEKIAMFFFWILAVFCFVLCFPLFKYRWTLYVPLLCFYFWALFEVTYNTLTVPMFDFTLIGIPFLLISFVLRWFYLASDLSDE